MWSPPPAAAASGASPSPWQNRPAPPPIRRGSSVPSSCSTLCPAKGRLGLAAVHQRSDDVQLRLRELQLRVAHFQLVADADFLPGAREPQPFLGGLFRLLRDPRLLPRGGELRDGLLHVGSDVAPAAGEVVLRQGNLHLGLADVGGGAEAVEDIPGQGDRSGELRIAVEPVRELPESLRGPVVPGADGQGRPVVALGDRGELPVLVGGARERLQAGAVLHRARDRVRRGRRLGRVLHQIRRLRHGQGLAGIDADGHCQIRPRQLHEALLAEALHLVVVPVGARRVDVGLRGAPALEQALRVVGLIPAARRGVAEHLQLALGPDQLIEPLLDEVGDLQPLFLDLRLARLESEVGGGQVVPPLAAVEDQLREHDRGAVPVGHHGGRSGEDVAAGNQPGRAFALPHLRARGVEVQAGKDRRARDHLVLFRGEREEDLPLQIRIALQRQLHGGVQRDWTRLRQGSRRDNHCKHESANHRYPPIATLTTRRRQSQAASVPISARLAGTSPTAATPNAIMTAAQSEKKSTALPSLSAAPDSVCPRAARTALTFRGVRTAGPTRRDWPKAANSEQAKAMATARAALPTLACRSMPESGATNATKAGGAARVDCGSSASLDTIKTDLRGCRLYDRDPPLFRFRDVTSNRGGVTMPTYAAAASSAPDHLVARRRAPLPDGGGRRQHVEIRSPAGAYLRGARALSQSFRAH